MKKEKKHRSDMTRRGFIKSSAIGLSAPLILPRSVFGANEKVNVAWVGFMHQGWGDLSNCSNDENVHVVALCDCDKDVWKKGKEKFGEAKYFADFREMLEKMGDKIDAVGIATPDHTHFAIAHMAMSRGKHVFVEKPLVHSLGRGFPGIER